MKIKELEARRLSACRYFDKGKTTYFVGKKFSVASPTTREWKRRWQNETLKAKKQGYPSKLSDNDKRKLTQKIIKCPETAGYSNQLWTIRRITDLIYKEFEIKHKPRSVWHLLYSPGFSCQKPERKPRERSERVIKEWKLKK